MIECALRYSTQRSDLFRYRGHFVLAKGTRNHVEGFDLLTCAEYCSDKARARLGNRNATGGSV